MFAFCSSYEYIIFTKMEAEMKKPLSVCLVVTILTMVGAGFLSQSDNLSDRAKALHQRAIVLDAHSDVILRVLDKGVDLGVRSDQGHMDIPRLIEGGIDAQVFAIWVSPSYLPNQAIKRALNMIDAVYHQIEKHPDKLELARTASDIERIAAQNKIAVILGLEGGHIIEDDMAVLRMFYQLGVRYMTLTWMNTNNWADAAGDTARWSGLNDFGVKVVKEMNRIGMIVDLSHVSDETFWDVLRVTSDPVIASHSSCRALCDHFRNLSDEMLRALAENGGVVGINFYAGYLDEEYKEQAERMRQELKEQLEALEREYKDHPEQYHKQRRALIEKKKRELKAVSLEKLIDHIDHAVKVAGIDHVGLGSDFDGCSVLPVGLEDCSKVPNITQALIERGYSDQEILKILGGNFLRVFREVVGK